MLALKGDELLLNKSVHSYHVLGSVRVGLDAVCLVSLATRGGVPEARVAPATLLRRPFYCFYVLLFTHVLFTCVILSDFEMLVSLPCGKKEDEV